MNLELLGALLTNPVFGIQMGKNTGIFNSLEFWRIFRQKFGDDWNLWDFQYLGSYSGSSLTSSRDHPPGGSPSSSVTTWKAPPDASAVSSRCTSPDFRWLHYLDSWLSFCVSSWLPLDNTILDPLRFPVAPRFSRSAKHFEIGHGERCQVSHCFHLIRTWYQHISWWPEHDEQ